MSSINTGHWMRRLFATVVTLLGVLLLGTPCHADLIIQVQDAQLAYGSEGFIDILISSTGTDHLFGFSAVVKNTTPDYVHGGLLFVSPIIDASTISASGGYVFLGDSSGYDVAATGGFPSTEVTVSDSTDVNPYVALGSTTRLLTRLKIWHNGNSAAVGDTFQISFLDAAGSTLFVDDSGIALSFDGSSDFTGTVTIVTPEPSTVGLLLFGSLGFAALRFRRRRLQSASA
jgi:hypothetical protein